MSINLNEEFKKLYTDLTSEEAKELIRQIELEVHMFGFIRTDVKLNIICVIVYVSLYLSEKKIPDVKYDCI